MCGEPASVTGDFPIKLYRASQLYRKYTYKYLSADLKGVIFHNNNILVGTSPLIH